MSIEITQKIKGYRIKKEGETTTPSLLELAKEKGFEGSEEDLLNLIKGEGFVSQDECPLTKRIDRRPEGALEAISEKVDMVGADGRKKVYVIVSFMPVTGVQNGQEVTVERPVEFFFPAGQLSSEYQWITATMRSLSLAARGGYVTQALQDLRKVAWDKGLVRCGMNRWGKPAFHDSEAAAIAWSIQQILHRRGFLDEEGNQVPVDELVSTYSRRHAGFDFETERDESFTVTIMEDEVKEEPVAGSNVQSVGACPECSSDLVLMDGCPTCVEGCGWSKCG